MKINLSKIHEYYSDGEPSMAYNYVDLDKMKFRKGEI